MFEAADSRSVDRRRRHDEARRLHELFGDTGVFGLTAPGRALRTLEHAAAREREGEPRADEQKTKTPHHGRAMRAIA